MTGQQLCKAARDGDTAKVSTLLSTQGAQSFINYQDAHGFTPLHDAASNGHAAVTKQLIAARCDVDLQQEDGGTPLHYAAQNGLEAVTEKLIAARCNVDLQANDGATPLLMAAAQGHEAVTKQLIAARCNVDLQDKNGFTPLHAAADYGHETVTKQLLDVRCSVDLQANDGATALQLAEGWGHAGIATLIRNKKHKGADRGKKDTLLQASPEELKKQLEDAHSFKPHFVRHSQVLNSLWKPLHLGVRDGMVEFPHPQNIIQLLLLFLVLVMITRRCCLSRQLAYAGSI
jgi:ankyrin repeat protein